MITHLHKNFLTDLGEYRASEGFWMSRWQRELLDNPRLSDWLTPWISTGSPDCLDGNPIFSAYSPSLRKGVRIIQHEPTSRKLEIQAWPDFVGGSYFDPDAIRELVISCALSEDAADWAMSLIRLWIADNSIILDEIATYRLPSDWAFDGYLLPSAA